MSLDLKKSNIFLCIFIKLTLVASSETVIYFKAHKILVNTTFKSKLQCK